jgi:hypothetical protein
MLYLNAMPGRKCTVCNHLRRPEIDTRLANGEDDVTVSRAYGLTQSAVFRHRSKHARLPATQQAKQAMTQASVALASLPSRDELGAMLGALLPRLDAIENDAKAKGSSLTQLKAIGEMRQTIADIARVAGATGSSNTTVNVNVDVTQADPRVEFLVDMLRPAINAEGFALLENVIDVPSDQN